MSLSTPFIFFLFLTHLGNCLFTPPAVDLNREQSNPRPFLASSSAPSPAFIIIGSSSPPTKSLIFINSSFYKNSFRLSSHHQRSPKINHQYLFALLLIAGDIETHPGPCYKYPCGSCARPCKSNQQSIQCDRCDVWSHRKCLNMSLDTFDSISDPSASWCCSKCTPP